MGLETTVLLLVLLLGFGTRLELLGLQNLIYTESFLLFRTFLSDWMDGFIGWAGLLSSDTGKG